MKILGWLRRNFFASWYDALLTVGLVGPVCLVLVRLVDWAFLRAAFGTTRESCLAASGACWSIIGDMWPLFLVGLYPPEARWRVVAAAVLVAALAVPAFVPGLRRRRVVQAAWIVAPLPLFLLISGSDAIGWPAVETQKWGGLMLTLILAAVGQTLAFPLGVALALARRSRRMPVVRALAVIYIEGIRSIPLVMILVMATLTLPLFLPPGAAVDRLATAQIGIILFSAASLAEVVRGGLQGVPAGQAEAAEALGLNYRQAMRRVVLPQALRLVQPALVNTFITFVKGSSLVVAIGLYDLLGAAMLASANQNWVGYTVEPLLFVAGIFWVICFSMSRVSARLERRFAAGRVTGPALA